jgi:putative tryptophan/tyrosine transport system substrate-binding protein
MGRLVLFILACAILLPVSAGAYDVLILQSQRDTACDEVLKGYRFEEKTSVRLLTLSDYAEVDVVRIVREERPKVILAIGNAALRAARQVSQIPVVAVLSLGVHDKKSSHPNLTGIGMFVSPEHYIRMFQTMRTRRVGVIYNPASSGWYLRLARQAAETYGIELVAREVSTSREVIERLSGLAGKVDALWMLPDSTAVARETVEAYFRFGQQQAVPVVAFATNYLGLGAAAVLEIDRIALGRQAEDIVTDLLNDTYRDGISLSFPRGISVRTNPSVLKRLGFSFTERDFR